MIDEQSEQILSKLYPPFAEKLRQLIGVLGEGWRVDEGFRTFQEQDAFYEQGRSRPGALITKDRAGYSGHNYGTVAHVRPVNDEDRKPASFLKLAEATESLGLQWGGNDPSGKFVEMSRVEMVVLPILECLTIFKQGQLPGVWTAFDAKLGIVKPEVGAIEEPAEEPMESGAKQLVEASPVVAREAVKNKE